MELRLLRSVVEFFLFSCLVVVTSAQDPTPADFCASHPCENGGTCTSLPNAFICRCPEDYSGVRCETHSSEHGQTACYSSPCRNGGDCVSTALQQFTCMCPTTWRGSTCEIDVDECTGDPCRNGASCQNGPGNYTCVCLVGYAGKTCEEDVRCTTNMCSNNGTCIMMNEQQICVCPTGFSGETCQDRDICSPNPCKNGHCRPSEEDPNGYLCRCHAGYSARLCDQQLHAACSHSGDTFYDGEVRDVDCNRCHCRDGEWLCTKKFCGSIEAMFDFMADFNSIVQGKEDHFKRSLTTALATDFSIEESMIGNLMVSAGSIHVEFELVALLESNLNIEDVATEMLAKLDSGTYYFRFEETTLFVDQSSIKFEKVDAQTDDPGAPVISNVVLVVVCVLVSLFLIIAVIIGTVVIIVHRKHSEKTSPGQFRGRETREEYPMNNTNHIRHHNDLYSSVPNDNNGSLASSTVGQDANDLKDINIDMFAKASNSKPRDHKSGLDHV